MFKIVRTAAFVTALAVAASACAGVPPAAIVALQGVAAVAAETYCSPAAAEIRSETRAWLFGDPSLTVVTRSDC